MCSYEVINQNLDNHYLNITNKLYTKYNNDKDNKLLEYYLDKIKKRNFNINENQIKDNG